MLKQYDILWGNVHLRSAEQIKAHLDKDRNLSRYRDTADFIEGDYVLDVGCGEGIITKYASSKAKKVLALDTSPNAIDVARDFSSSFNIEYCVGDIFTIHFTDNTFDCVIFTEIIEHLSDPVRHLKEIHRILKPNGYLIISTPNALSYNRIGNYLLSFWFGNKKKMAEYTAAIDREERGTGTDLDHIFCWTFDTLYRLLSRNGFRYVDHKFSAFYPFVCYLKGIRVSLFGDSELCWLAPFVRGFSDVIIFKVKAIK